MYVGKPLGAHLFRGSCADYVGSPLAPNRRIILVKTLAHVPEELHIAAMLLGARVQQQVDRSGGHSLVRESFAGRMLLWRASWMGPHGGTVQES